MTDTLVFTDTFSGGSVSSTNWTQTLNGGSATIFEGGVVIAGPSGSLVSASLIDKGTARANTEVVLALKKAVISGTAAVGLNSTSVANSAIPNGLAIRWQQSGTGLLYLGGATDAAGTVAPALTTSFQYFRFRLEGGIFKARSWTTTEGTTWDYTVDLTGRANQTALTQSGNTYLVNARSSTGTASQATFDDVSIYSVTSGVDVGYNAQVMFGTVDAPGGIGMGNRVRHDITDDAFVRQAGTSENYGLADYLKLDSNYGSYLKFPAYSGSEVVTDSKLWLTPTSVSSGSARSISIYRVDAAWSESTITSGNAPAVTLLRTVSVTPTVGTSFSLDVTGANTGHGVLVKQGASSTLDVASSEHATSAYRPYVAYSTAPQADVSLTPAPVLASASLPESSVEATDTVSVGSTPLTGVADMSPATVSTVQFQEATIASEPMQGFADTPQGADFSSPTQFSAGPATASGEALDVAVTLEQGLILEAVPMTARAAWKQPSAVNGQPIVLDEADDRYFQRVFADGPKTWFRLNDKGSTAAARVGALGGIYSGVQTGQFTGPDNRHSVYFNGSAYLEQTEPSGTNEDETLTYPAGTRPQTTLEFSFRTTKANSFLWAGKDNAVSSAFGSSNTGFPTREMYLRDGKISFRTHYFPNSLGNTEPSWEFTGFTNLADGQWHSIVVRSYLAGSTDDGGVEIWVDGKFEIRRYRGGAVLGFPDYIGSRPAAIDGHNIGALPSSLNFVGDMSEVVFYDKYLSEDSIPKHYYDFMGWQPIEAQPLEAFGFTPAGSNGRGNQKRALYLYWSTQVDAYNIGVFQSGTNQMNFDMFAGNWWTRKETVRDYAGWKVFTKSIVTKNNETDVYRDPFTDRRSPIDLEKDLNLDEYDAIFFGDWPDSSAEFDYYRSVFPEFTKHYERLLSQLRDANNKGIGLMVTHPRLAVDLGIIDRVESIPTLKESKSNPAQGNALGLYDYGSAAKFPWNIVDDEGLEGSTTPGATGTGLPMNTDPVYLNNKAFFYADNNFNNRERVRALIDGLTTLPAYMIADAIYHRERDVWGWSLSAFKYLHRMNGLQIGDEFIFPGTSPGNSEYGSATYFKELFARSRGTLATPLANVKAGTVVTTFGAKHWLNQQEVDNPYKDYATTIVLQPGDVLKGRAVGGKIFVNFTEGPSTFLQTEEVYIDVLPGSEYDDGTAVWPMNYLPDTDAQREWEFSQTRTTLNTTGSPISTTVINVTLPDGTVTQTVSGRPQFQMTTGNALFRETTRPTAAMVRRGLEWLKDRIETEPGAVTTAAESMEVSGTMPKPVTVAQRSNAVTADAFVALAQMPKVAEDTDGEVEIRTLPMRAEATFTGFSKVISAAPMTATATLVENFNMVHATGEQIVLTLHGLDLITLYLKEEG